MKKGRRSSNLLSIYVTTSSPSSYKIIYFFAINFPALDAESHNLFVKLVVACADGVTCRIHVKPDFLVA